jgi:hypothetical protein
MHMQVRFAPARPEDLEGALRVLADNNVNLVAAGGSNLDAGGEFAFAVDHGEEDHAVELLRDSNFEARRVEVRHFELSDRPGQLHAAIAEVSRENSESGRVIQDVVVGTPTADGAIPIQVYSREIEPGYGRKA